MIDEKLLKKISIRLDRTQTPPTPHSIRRTEEERFRVIRCVIDIFKLGEIPVRYAYSIVEQNAIIGVMRPDSEQSVLYDVPKDKTLPIDERIRQLVLELRTLTRPKESLRIDSKGYLQDGQSFLQHAPLIEWYQILESLGRCAGLVSDTGSKYLFPPVIELDGEELQIPALTLEELRDRINRIAYGQWPTEAIEDTGNNSNLPTTGSGSGQPDGKSTDEGSGTSSQFGSDSVKQRTKTIQLSRMIFIAQGRDGHYYRVPESYQDITLPTKMLVSGKIQKAGIVYKLFQDQIGDINPDLKHLDREQGDEE
mgnify:FL=1